MERMIQTGVTPTPIPQKRIPVKQISEMESTIPERSMAGPVSIGELMEPIRQIVYHPDRNRLMAELFKDYK